MISPYKKDFYKLLDDIHVLYPNYKLPGEQSDPDLENIHLKTNITWGHKSSALHKIDQHDDQFDIMVHFLTLAGAYGPLPDAQTEFIIDKIKDKDEAILAFFDIFHHRLLCCMYQNYRHCTVHSGSKNLLDNYLGYALFAISGMLFDYRMLTLDPRQLTNLQEMFWRNQKSPGGLLHTIQSYFNFPVKIQQFQGDWAYFPETNKLGKNLTTLNKDLYLGWRYYDPSYGIKVTFHNLTWEQYINFAPPNNTRIHELRSLIRRYIGVETHVRVQLELNPHEARKMKLGDRSYLNYTTWLINEPGKVREYKVSFKLF